MSLTVCASSTDDTLTTLASVKESLGLTDDDDDSYLTRLIRRASA